MLNQAAVEALCSASYVEDYFDCVENMPDDLQRYITQMREYDVRYQDILSEIEHQQATLKQESDTLTRKRIIIQIQRALIRSQEIGDEKLQIVSMIQDMIENKVRQLDQDRKNLDFGKDQENTEPPKVEPQPERSSKRSRRQRNDNSVREEVVHEKQQEEKSSTSKKSKKKKRKSKAEKERDDSPIDQPIDPDEPTYCLCEQVSFGEMICCDNEQCHIEWFHFSCVGLNTKPKGKWYCPKCRGDRPNVMKPRT